MNRWKKLWRNRKQSDRIKTMLYLGIAAAAFLVMTAFDIAGLVRHINTPAEYVLSGGRVSEDRLEQLTDIDGIGAVTPAKNGSLTVKYRTAETVVAVTFVSAEYAKNVYGVERTGEIMTLFANGRGYEQILSALAGVGGAPERHSELVAEYTDGNRDKACRIVRVRQQTAAEEAFVFTIMADSSLRSQADSVRAFVPKQDIEQLAVGSLQELGYSVMNREDLLLSRNRIDRLFLELKYHLLIAAMCCLWIATLRSTAQDRKL